MFAKTINLIEWLPFEIKIIRSRVIKNFLQN